MLDDLDDRLSIALHFRTMETSHPLQGRKLRRNVPRHFQQDLVANDTASGHIAASRFFFAPCHEFSEHGGAARFEIFPAANPLITVPRLARSISQLRSQSSKFLFHPCRPAQRLEPLF